MIQSITLSKCVIFVIPRLLLIVWYIRNIEDKFQFKRLQKSWMLNTYLVKENFRNITHGSVLYIKTKEYYCTIGATMKIGSKPRVDHFMFKMLIKKE